MSKKLTSALAAAILGAAALSTPVMAEVSATAAYTSKYIYRGAGLGVAAANGSVNYSHDSGFSAGVWAIDDAGPGDGLEFDLFAAYGMDMDSWNWSLGYTSYQYTYSPLSQNEVNIGLGMGDFKLAIDVGGEDHSDVSSYERDYQHIAVTWAANDVYSLKIAQMDLNTDDDVIEDDEYIYAEVTASGEVAGLNASLTLGAVDEADNAEAYSVLPLDGYLTVTVSKTFDGLGF